MHHIKLKLKFVIYFTFKLVDLLAKIKKGLNLVVTDETPILADYLE